MNQAEKIPSITYPAAKPSTKPKPGTGTSFSNRLTTFETPQTNIDINNSTTQSVIALKIDEALDALEADNDYLTAGGVFPIELINNFIKAKRAECSQISQIPHPVEFEKYYNL